MGMIIVDLDDFKSINDTLGHEFGDRVLQLIAPRLAQALGPRDLLARLGGDEFAAVVPGIRNEGDALRCAERLLEVLQGPCEIDSMVLQVAGSIGVACYPQHGRTVDELLRHADVALYCAKTQHDTFATYAEDQDDYSIDRLALAAQLRRGIDRGELVVHYQPKVAAQGTGTHGVEALSRWNHPQLGRLGPEAFIPLAEQTGVIKQLTEYVLEAALAQCAAWRRDGLEVRMSVNVSTRSLLDHGLPETIGKLLGRYDVPSRLLQLEITEGRVVSDLGRARRVLSSSARWASRSPSMTSAPASHRFRSCNSFRSMRSRSIDRSSRTWRLTRATLSSSARSSSSGEASAFESRRRASRARASCAVSASSAATSSRASTSVAPLRRRSAGDLEGRAHQPPIEPSRLALVGSATEAA